VDPAAALREATERNAREAREEREAAARLEAAAAAAARAEAEAAAKARDEGAAKAQAEADVKAAEDPARSVVPESTDPQQSGPPTVEDLVPTGAGGADQTAPEREGTDPVVPGAEVARRAPDAGERGGGHPEGPEGPLAGAGLAMSRVLTTRASMRLRPSRAASAPRPAEAGAAGSSGADTEATSSAPPGWAPGAGPAALNLAVQDVLDKFSAHGATLLKARSEMVAMQTSVRVCS
jgi:hypothetical protein